MAWVEIVAVVVGAAISTGNENPKLAGVALAGVVVTDGVAVAIVALSLAAFAQLTFVKKFVLL
jgi:hypothetical protein